MASSLPVLHRETDICECFDCGRKHAHQQETQTTVRLHCYVLSPTKKMMKTFPKSGLLQTIPTDIMETKWKSRNDLLELVAEIAE